MNEYMKIAKNLAEDNLKTNYGGPFGACIVKDGKIIGRGSNQVLISHDPTAHAEVVAIRDACKNINSYDLSGCELYTSCYPCPMCMSAIIWANINKVYYGNTKEDAEMIGFRDKYIYDVFDKLKKGESNALNMKCIDREETIKAFNEYKEKKDKIAY
ncbi:MAG: nucleoside deaminase [Bacilli bacterium]|nr:nucleoside deaminase [Bacilli bacterium]MBR3209822.1 nucleoside deaminase [Bacilli bacterium]